MKFIFIFLVVFLFSKDSFSVPTDGVRAISPVASYQSSKNYAISSTVGEGITYLGSIQENSNVSVGFNAQLYSAQYDTTRIISNGEKIIKLSAGPIPAKSQLTLYLDANFTITSDFKFDFLNTLGEVIFF